MEQSVSEKGKKLFEEGKVKKEVETEKRIHFKVSGETEEHSVIFDKQKMKWLCDCRYSVLRQKECSHIVAAKLMK